MQSFGRYDITKYSSTSPLVIDTGMNWQFIRIMNKSAYGLNLNFSGKGSVDFPEMFLEDIALDNQYGGKLQIFPIADLSLIANAPSTTVVVNAYSQNDRHIPQSQPLTLVSNVGNTVTTNGTTNSLTNEGQHNVEVIDIGDDMLLKLWDIFSDGHATLSVDQAGVRHTAITIRSSGKPLLLGMSGDHVEVADTLDIDNKLFVVNQSSFDNGNASTDGTGVFTDKYGIMHTAFMLTTPAQITSSATLTVGSPVTYTVTGGGTPTIPSGVTAVFVVAFGVGSAAATYLQSYPDPSAPNAYFPIFGQAQGGNNDIAGSALCPVKSNQLVMQAFGGNITSFAFGVYGYII